jgi:hypothetical protein
MSVLIGFSYYYDYEYKLSILNLKSAELILYAHKLNNHDSFAPIGNKLKIKKLHLVGKYCSEKIRNIQIILNDKDEFTLVEREGTLSGKFNITAEGKIHLISEESLDGREIYPYLIEKKGSKKIVSFMLGTINLSKLYCINNNKV